VPGVSKTAFSPSFPDREIGKARLVAKLAADSSRRRETGRATASYNIGLFALAKPDTLVALLAMDLVATNRNCPLL
jgi:hypothetical protein